MDTTKLLIGIGIGGIIWLGLGLLVGGLCHSSYRGDEEMGVADTCGRDADADGYLADHDIGWDRGSAKTIAAHGGAR